MRKSLNLSHDEALHLTGTQHILNIMAAGQDDPEMAEIAEECKQEAYDLFLAAAEQEKNGRITCSKMGQ